MIPHSTAPKMLQSSILLLLALSLACVNAYECPEENKEEVDRDGFFHEGFHVGWDMHHVGWAAAGVMASIATIASLANIYLHCKNYNKPLEQRQIVRILLMPAIYSISSFFAYRYYRHYVYFAIIRDTYEAFVLASFLILCLLYVGRSPLEQQEVMKQKEKTPLVFPFCCFRYRPSKPYFLVATKWSVLQYVILRPMISATALITDTQKAFCASSYSPHFANLWLTILIFISATLALYGLLITKHLAKEDLQGHRPTCKFMSIKIAVFLVFYQSFLLSFFDHLGFFQATEYWSRSNIADGVNALATTVEMAIVGLFQLYAFPYTEYRALIKGSEANRQKSVWKNFLHSQDYRDFGRDILMGLGFWLDRIRGAEYTKSRHATPQGANGLDFQAAFGLDPAHARIRDHEWIQAHDRPSSGTTQKGWADHEGGLDDVWDSKLGGQKQSQSFETCAEEPAYESIKLGQVDPQYPDPSSSPPYRSSPFADHPSDGRIPRSTDLDTLVHSSASSRHKRVDSEESSHSADSQPGVLLGPPSSADYPHQEFHTKN
ncbi:uncharacterized protein PGTG_15713 [Puccinia graminis f. sp. tritici CRL 75-36-700-3]|uniref:DUF300-domain-containing protein n=1 Tax=Puccinia graminis f. sp. tritici (strain CRL 75-36-700-3 / race SCCL) TaxID=418459 RepID=E3KZ39_PUCGT|nr:uncharacterized protein PGTG_15713 [Puccinia graminis f. sp. tritici CRL 75-36-700-3]EFP89564.1 hypothetical protein PGTG_15713 [Puccinia graminis f. sp. tritici CRL 75-36-700-3]